MLMYWPPISLADCSWCRRLFVVKRWSCSFILELSWICCGSLIILVYQTFRLLSNMPFKFCIVDLQNALLIIRPPRVVKRCDVNLFSLWLIRNYLLLQIWNVGLLMLHVCCGRRHDGSGVGMVQFVLMIMDLSWVIKASLSLFKFS